MPPLKFAPTTSGFAFVTVAAGPFDETSVLPFLRKNCIFPLTLPAAVQDAGPAYVSLAATRPVDTLLKSKCVTPLS